MYIKLLHCVDMFNLCSFFLHGFVNSWRVSFNYFAFFFSETNHHHFSCCGSVIDRHSYYRPFARTRALIGQQRATLQLQSGF